MLTPEVYIEESRSTSTTCCCGGGRFSEDVSVDNTIGAAGSARSGGCCLRRRRGSRGRPKTSCMPRSSAALVRFLLSLSIHLLSALLSAGLTGLVLWIARSAKIDATRRCLVLWRRSGVSTIKLLQLPRRQGKPAAKNYKLQQLVSKLVFSSYAAAAAHKCDNTTPPNHQQLTGYSTTSTRCAVQP